jgi:hypothetical protein
MLRSLSDTTQDLRFGLRILRRSPVFTLVAVLSLALGIGGATSVFSLINAIVLRRLPVADADRLFVATRDLGNETVLRFSWASVTDLQSGLADRAELAAAGIAAVMQVRFDGRVAERALVQLVSGEYFEVLRQRPQFGRLLTPADNQVVGGHPVAVISHAYWRRQLGGAQDAVGRVIAINGTAFTVVGITMPEFFGTTVSIRTADAWVPLMMQSAVRYSTSASSHGSADMRKPRPPQADVLAERVRAAASRTRARNNRGRDDGPASGRRPVPAR